MGVTLWLVSGLSAIRASKMPRNGHWQRCLLAGRLFRAAVLPLPRSHPLPGQPSSRERPRAGSAEADSRRSRSGRPRHRRFPPLVAQPAAPTRPAATELRTESKLHPASIGNASPRERNQKVEVDPFLSRVRANRATAQASRFGVACDALNV